MFFNNNINIYFQNVNAIPDAIVTVTEYHIYHVVFYAGIMGIIAIVKLESMVAILAMVARSACFTEAMLVSRFSLLAILESSLTRRANAQPVSPV